MIFLLAEFGTDIKQVVLNREQQMSVQDYSGLIASPMLFSSSVSPMQITRRSVLTHVAISQSVCRNRRFRRLKKDDYP